MIRKTFIANVALLGVAMFSLADCAAELVIESNQIRGIVGNTIGSGNGTLDMRLFTFSGGDIDNAAGGFDGDNANNGLPNTGGNSSFSESYLTTAGELQDFYDLNFGVGVIDELVFFLDLNETGGGKPINTLGVVDIYTNRTSINGNPDPTGDLTGSQQDAINQTGSGGTFEARLASSTGYNLPVLAQGAGFADYIIATGINPYALNASDQILINISMSDLNNGAEKIFLSGEFAADDLVFVPEPSSIACFLLGISFVGRRRRS